MQRLVSSAMHQSPRIFFVELFLYYYKSPTCYIYDLHEILSCIQFIFERPLYEKFTILVRKRGSCMGSKSFVTVEMQLANIVIPIWHIMDNCQELSDDVSFLRNISLLW